MKAIMISVRPKWVCKIVDDKTKKDEIRKGSSLYKAINKLIEEQGVAPMLIYCTKEYQGSRHVPTYYLNGKVVARFNATAEEFPLEDLDDYNNDDIFIANSCLTVEEMRNYFNHILGEDGYGYVIHINDLEIFDKPKEINEFKTKLHIKGGCKNCPQNTGLSMSYCKNCDFLLPLTRAPKSWCYIEV